MLNEVYIRTSYTLDIVKLNVLFIFRDATFISGFFSFIPKLSTRINRLRVLILTSSLSGWWKIKPDRFEKHTSQRGWINAHVSTETRVIIGGNCVHDRRIKRIRLSPVRVPISLNIKQISRLRRHNICERAYRYRTRRRNIYRWFVDIRGKGNLTFTRV